MLVTVRDCYIERVQRWSRSRLIHGNKLLISTNLSNGFVVEQADIWTFVVAELPKNVKVDPASVRDQCRVIELNGLRVVSDETAEPSDFPIESWQDAKEI